MEEKEMLVNEFVETICPKKKCNLHDEVLECSLRLRKHLVDAPIVSENDDWMYLGIPLQRKPKGVRAEEIISVLRGDSFSLQTFARLAERIETEGLQN